MSEPGRWWLLAGMVGGGPVITTLLTLLAGPAILVSFSGQPKEDDDHSDIVMPTPRR